MSAIKKHRRSGAYMKERCLRDTMQKMINRTARYIVGIWGLSLLFLLACVSNDGGMINESMRGILLPVSFILFFVVTGVWFVTYLIHLIWMIREKWWTQSVRSNLGFIVVLVLVLCMLDLYKGTFAWSSIAKCLFWSVMVVVFLDIGNYVYRWKDTEN